MILDTDKIQHDGAYREELRHLCLTDHFFLAEMMGFRQFNRVLHQPAVELYFPKNPKLRIEDQHSKHNRMHLDPRGTFKALSLDTLIPTPTGMRTMEDIEVGDMVYADDGKKCTVTGVSPIYIDRPCFEIEFSSHEKIVCDADHLWVTDTRSDRDRKKRRKVPCHAFPTVKTTRQIANTLMCRQESNHRIALCGAVAGMRRRFTISPYVLGAWIGDGSVGTSNLTLPSLQKGEVIEQLKIEGESVKLFQQAQRAQTCAVKMLAPRLRKLGCLNSKTIPKEYLNASVSQRIALLQGLMDTDGSASVTGECFFSTSKYALAVQVRELVASLGLKPTIFRFNAFIGDKDYGMAYRVRFMAYRDTPVFRMKRHLENMVVRDSKKSSLSKFRQIVSAKRVESRPVKCIQVDSPSKLYLASEGFIPTHNTTLGRVDTLQWMLAFPEMITILNESATQPLAKEISKKTAEYLWQGKGRPRTPLQLLFSELVTDEEPLKSGEKWNNVLRRYDPSDLDSTLAFTSPQSTQSGWHPFIINPDDMVETKNSGIRADAEVRRGVIDTYDQNENLLRAGGYINIRGTRYHPMDLYGDILDKMDPDLWKILIRSTMTVKSGMRLLPGEFPAEDDCVMHFAELPGMDYKTMRAKFHKNYESFMAQQQNDPQGGNVAVFDDKLYQTMLIAPERVPPIGETLCFWRFPVASKKNMLEAEGVCGRLWDGKGYVIDAWSGVYTPSRLAEKVVRECKRAQTGLVVAEDTPGAHYMEQHIRNEAMRKNFSIRFQWLAYDDDENVRVERIRQMEPQARAGKVMISTGAGKQQELKKQLLNFGLVPENGLVDCMSRMAAKVPMSLFRAEMEAEEKEMQMARRQATMNHFVYGQDGGTSELNERQEREREASAASWMAVDNCGLTDILGGLDG